MRDMKKNINVQRVLTHFLATRSVELFPEKSGLKDTRTLKRLIEKSVSNGVLRMEKYR
jgi:hypothetical protein